MTDERKIIGSNTLRLNEATMIAVLQAWLDEEMKSLVVVLGVKEQTDGFVVRVSGKEAEQ